MTPGVLTPGLVSAGAVEVTVAFLAWLESSRPGLAAHAELLLGERLPAETDHALRRVRIRFPGRGVTHDGYDPQIDLDGAAVVCDLAWFRPGFTALAGPAFLWRTQGVDSECYLVSPER